MSAYSSFWNAAHTIGYTHNKFSWNEMHVDDHEQRNGFETTFQN